MTTQVLSINSFPEIDVIAPAIAGASETLFIGTVSDDAVSSIKINNASTVNGVFAPRIVVISSGTNIGLQFRSRITTDTGTNAATLFISDLAAGGSIAVRPTFEWDNSGTLVMQLTAGGFLGVGVAGATAFVHPAASTTAAASLRIPSGVAPTTPNEGDIWNDSTQKDMVTYVNGRRQDDIKALATTITTATVGNTTTETTTLGTVIGSFATPAGFFNVTGKRIKIRQVGTFQTKATTPGNGTWRIAAFSPTYTITIAMPVALAFVYNWELDFDLTIRTTGSSGTIWGSLILTLTDTSTGVVTKFSYIVGGTNNLTNAYTITSTFQWATADVLNSLSCYQANLDVAH